MTDEVSAEREQLLAEYERLTGARPRWLDELKDEGVQWHLDQLRAAREDEAED